VELPERVPLLRLALPLALGIWLEDRLELAPVYGAALALVGLGSAPARTRRACAGESLLGIGWARSPWPAPVRSGAEARSAPSC
jgi:hypothetical protein